MKKLFLKFDHYLALGYRLGMIFLTLFLTGMMAFAVFLRYVLDQSLPAIEEASILVGLWLYFIAMVAVTRERSHLTGGIIDLFDLSHRTRMRIKAFNDLVGLCVICIFAWYAFKYLAFTMKINRASTNLGWPTALWISASIFGFSLMAMYKVRDLFIHEDTYTQYDNKSPHPASAKLKENA